MDHLQSFCSNKNLKKKKIVFNLKSLFFVGSTGVGAFSKTLDFVKQNNNLKICCASSEFEKLFISEGLDSVLFSSEKEAVSSFSERQSGKEAFSFTQNEYPLKHEG